MAVTFVKRSTLPETGRGKAGSCSVTISGNGQATLSSVATKFFSGSPLIAFAYEAGKVFLFRQDAKIVAKAKMEEKDLVVLRSGKKSPTASFSATGLLRDAKTFTEGLYDFKASGNQTFPATEDATNGCVSFTLPVGALPAKPVNKRPKKVKTDATKANPGSTEGEAVDLKLDEPELVVAA